MDNLDCDEAFRLLHEKILKFYNLHCPIRSKTVSYKDFEKPWITTDIKQKMRLRQSYFKLFRRNLMSKSEYNTYRNFVTDQIRQAKKQYYHKLFLDARKDTKRLGKI